MDSQPLAYCRAYVLGDLRRFPGWIEQRIHWVTEDGDPPVTGTEAVVLPDTEVVFVHDDFVVTRSIRKGESVLLEAPTPDWIAYCRTTLGMQIPDDIRETR